MFETQMKRKNINCMLKVFFSIKVIASTVNRKVFICTQIYSGTMKVANYHDHVLNVCLPEIKQINRGKAMHRCKGKNAGCIKNRTLPPPQNDFNTNCEAVQKGRKEEKKEVVMWPYQKLSGV